MVNKGQTQVHVYIAKDAYTSHSDDDEDKEMAGFGLIAINIFVTLLMNKLKAERFLMLS